MAVISDLCRSAENVTVRVVALCCDVRTVKPRVGTADTRHTPPSPNRTDARPPVDRIVCTPAPPSEQPARPGLAVVGDGFGAAGARGVGFLVVALAAGLGSEREADGFGVPLGDGGAEDGAVGDGNTVGSERATGGFGLVEPTTKWTVSTTAVALTAVHDSHMSR